MVKLTDAILQVTVANMPKLAVQITVAIRYLCQDLSLLTGNYKSNSKPTQKHNLQILQMQNGHYVSIYCSDIYIT